jgi:hypothetical protein
MNTDFSESIFIRDRSIVVKLGLHLIASRNVSVVFHLVQCVIGDGETVVRPARSAAIVGIALYNIYTHNFFDGKESTVESTVTRAGFRAQGTWYFW